MVKLDLLNNKIKDSGMTVVSIARKTGVSRETIYNKLNGSVEFKASEILSISDALGLSAKERNEIFLQSDVNLIQQNDSKTFGKEV